MRTAQVRVKERALYNVILIRQQSDGKTQTQKETKSSALGKIKFVFLLILEFFLCFLFFLVPTD
jgi:hypothetical protein